MSDKRPLGRFILKVCMGFGCVKIVLQKVKKFDII